MKHYLNLGYAFLRDRSRNDLAYIGGFWIDLSSTFFYVVTFLLFTQLLYTRVGTIGNFTKDDFLFMTLIGQFTFYIWAQVQYSAMVRLVENVRNGTFDYMLLRPVSTKFYTYISGIRPVYTIFVSLPNIVLFCFVINWSNIHVTVGSCIAGAVVWVCAMLVLATVMLALALPVFTQGDASDMLDSSYALLGVTEIPFNYLPKGMQFLSFTLLPTILATAGTAYVMLHKGPYILIVAGSIIAAFLSVLCFNTLWKRAINNYSSASS